MLDMRKGTCGVCGHNEIVEGVVREYVVTKEPPIPWRRIFSSHPIDASGGPCGKLMVYMCRGCGHVQWFAENPQAVPIGAAYDTRLISGSEPLGPYR
jgi:hypothetical protein